MKQLKEFRHTVIYHTDCALPLYDEVDVLVCGGGPAGIAAASMAARAAGWAGRRFHCLYFMGLPPNSITKLLLIISKRAGRYKFIREISTGREIAVENRAYFPAILGENTPPAAIKAAGGAG